MRKVAIGLFHFNVQWSAGDADSYHRYVQSAIVPFLTFARSRSWFKASIDMAGSCLEFINQCYPEVLEMLRNLIQGDQIELLSALYTPAAWVAFPGSDAKRSIELNREALQKLHLRAAPIFFSQEAFFGTGVAEFHEWFDAAICKDDYLEYLLGPNQLAPCFLHRGMPVIVASNHLLNELDRCSNDRMPLRYRRHLREARELNKRGVQPARSGQSDSLEWLWYHCGDGNHFSTTFPPNNWMFGDRDSQWEALTSRYLKSLPEAGYEFATVGEFFRMVNQRPVATFDNPLLDAVGIQEGAKGCTPGWGSVPTIGTTTPPSLPPPGSRGEPCFAAKPTVSVDPLQLMTPPMAKG